MLSPLYSNIMLNELDKELECKLRNRPVRNCTQGGVRAQIGN